MSDDEVDEELLDLLRKSMGMQDGTSRAHPKLHVLEDAEFIYDNATDVAIGMQGTKAAAEKIYQSMQEKEYSTKSWSEHELHPKAKDASTVDFIFLMDLLNFCFWSDSNVSNHVYTVEYNGKSWTGYWSLVAAIRRALDAGIPFTSPFFWIDETRCTDEVIRDIFRSSTEEKMPLLEERIRCMREAGRVLEEQFQGSFANLLERGDKSACKVVNILVEEFPCFNDEHSFEGRLVRLYKRPQILIADLWACFEGESYGEFTDIEQVTMFADYRIPQMLHSLDCISYSPPLESHIRRLRTIESGHSWEVQLRGCSIWSVELLRRQIKRDHSEAHINAILIDFFLYDTVKQMMADGAETIPHHRTRSIWY